MRAAALALVCAGLSGGPAPDEALLARCRAARSDLAPIRPERFLRLTTTWEFDPEPGQRRLHYRATRLAALDGRFYLAVVGIDTDHRFRYACDADAAWAESVVSGNHAREAIAPASARGLADQAVALQLLFGFPWLPDDARVTTIAERDDRVLVALGEREFVLEVETPEHLPRRIALRSGGLRGEVLAWGRLEGYPNRARVPIHWRFEDARFAQAWEERLEDGDFSVVYPAERLADLLESRAVEVVAAGPEWEAAPLAIGLGLADEAPLTLQGAVELARRSPAGALYRVVYERARLEALVESAQGQAIPAGTLLELTTVRNPRFLALEVARPLVDSPSGTWVFQPRLTEEGSRTTLALQVGRALPPR